MISCSRSVRSNKCCNTAIPHTSLADQYTILLAICFMFCKVHHDTQHHEMQRLYIFSSVENPTSILFKVGITVSDKIYGFYTLHFLSLCSISIQSFILFPLICTGVMLSTIKDPEKVVKGKYS